MANRNKDKGTYHEKWFVDWLKQIGFQAKRVPLSGALGGEYSGDIKIALGGQDLVGEVKYRDKSNFPSAFTVMEGRDIAFFKRKNGKPNVLVIMTKEVFELIWRSQVQTRKDEIEAAAKQFALQNPKVWEMFEQFTLEAIGKGFKHYSTNSIFQRIRWETDIPDEYGDSTFKINNNYAPYYARWFMTVYPEYDGFFRTRSLSTEDKDPVGRPELTPADFPYNNQGENNEQPTR